MRRRHARIAQRRVALDLLDHLRIFFARRNRAHPEGNNGKPTQRAPFFAQHLVQGLGDLRRVRRQRAVAHARRRDLRKGRLQRRQELTLELAVQGVAGVGAVDIADNIRVKEHRVRDAVGIFAEAFDRDVHIQANVLVDHAKRHRARRAVFVADDLLRVHIIHPLIVRRLRAKGEALAHRLEAFDDAAPQLAAEQARLRRCIVGEGPRLRTELDDLALVGDEHALPLRHHDHRARRDQVVAALAVDAAPPLILLAFFHKLVRAHTVADKIILPGVRQHTAEGTNTSAKGAADSFKSHKVPP